MLAVATDHEFTALESASLKRTKNCRDLKLAILEGLSKYLGIGLGKFGAHEFFQRALVPACHVAGANFLNSQRRVGRLLHTSTGQPCAVQMGLRWALLILLDHTPRPPIRTAIHICHAIADPAPLIGSASSDS